LLGRKATDLPSLLEGVREIPDSSIYHHMHRFLFQHQYLSPEPPNDFSYWLREVLNEDAMAERLSSIDMMQFDSIDALRRELIQKFEECAAGSTRRVGCPVGEEFHFMACKTFVLPTHTTAASLGEFAGALSTVSISSLFFHMFDARLRVGHGQNDFSRWFDDQGWSHLAESVRNLDPYTYTMDGLRKRLLVLIKHHGTS
jgi:hypothetical protein